jgi:hypothetical protein
MKHIKLFEDWGDPINRGSEKFILMKINHYLTQEKAVGYYDSMREAMKDFLRYFSEFIKDEWGGSPKAYFSEWNKEVEKINSWKEFFSLSPVIEETTFYIEDFNPSRTAKVFSETELLSQNDTSYLESFLPFS